jgi:hypothetical protein
MSLPAGVEPPAPDAFDDVGVVHALDGDATAFCDGDLDLEQVDHQLWNNAPSDQRCRACVVKLTAVAG